MKKESFEFKPVKLCIKFDLVGGFGKYIFRVLKLIATNEPSIFPRMIELDAPHQMQLRALSRTAQVLKMFFWVGLNDQLVILSKYSGPQRNSNYYCCGQMFQAFVNMYYVSPFLENCREGSKKISNIHTISSIGTILQ